MRIRGNRDDLDSIVESMKENLLAFAILQILKHSKDYKKHEREVEKDLKERGATIDHFIELFDSKVNTLVKQGLIFKTIDNKPFENGKMPKIVLNITPNGLEVLHRCLSKAEKTL